MHGIAHAASFAAVARALRRTLRPLHAQRRWITRSNSSKKGVDKINVAANHHTALIRCCPPPSSALPARVDYIKSILGHTLVDRDKWMRMQT